MSIVKAGMWIIEAKKNGTRGRSLENDKVDNIFAFAMHLMYNCTTKALHLHYKTIHYDKSLPNQNRRKTQKRF